MFEQIVVKLARAAVPGMMRPRSGPHTQSADSGRRTTRNSGCRIEHLVERHQEGVEVPNPSCQERLFHKMLQPLRLQPGQLLCVSVVEREQGFSQRFAARYVGWSNGLQLSITHVHWTVGCEQSGQRMLATRDNKLKSRSSGMII